MALSEQSGDGTHRADEDAEALDDVAHAANDGNHGPRFIRIEGESIIRPVVARLCAATGAHGAARRA